MVKKFGNHEIGKTPVCQRRDSQAYLYYQDEDKVWVKDPNSVNFMCEVKTFDYSKPKAIVPDPTNPKPAKPEPAVRVFDLKQKVALMVWDAAPEGNAAVIPAPKRNANWVAKMMDQNNQDFEKGKGKKHTGKTNVNVPVKPNKPTKPAVS